MAEIKLTALRTFEGTEGLIRRGDVFKVESDERAENLKRLSLATDADKDADITNFSQRNKELDSLKKEELIETAEKEGVSFEGDAQKDEIKAAILRHRESNYLTDQHRNSAFNSKKGTETGGGLAESAGGSGSSGTGAASGTTGAGSASNSGASAGGASGTSGASGASGASGSTGGTA